MQMDLHTDRYYYKSPNPPTHFLHKSFFFIIRIWIYEEHLQKMTGCNKYMTLIIHTWLNLSFVMYRVECLSLTAYTNERNTTYDRVPVLDTFVYTVLFFYRTLACLLMLKQAKNVGKRMETAVLYHSPIFLPIYNPPSSPSDKIE